MTRPLIVRLAMSEVGMASRILAAPLGSLFTYASPMHPTSRYRARYQVSREAHARTLPSLKNSPNTFSRLWRDRQPRRAF